MLQTAYKTEATVGSGGKLRLATPLLEGTGVEVVILTFQGAHKLKTDVLADGLIEVQVPFLEGTWAEVVVLCPQADDFKDLLEAAAANTDFWDNPQDDEAWNNA